MPNSVTQWIDRHPVLARRVRFVREIARTFMSIDPLRLAAALSYYALFSLMPLIIISLAIAGLVLDTETVLRAVQGEVATYLGPAGDQAIARVVTEVTAHQGSVIALVIGIGALAAAAIGVVTEITGGLNMLWGVGDRPVTVRSFLAEKLRTLGIVVIFGLALVATLVANEILTFFDEVLLNGSVHTHVLFDVLNHAVTILIVSVLFMFLFRVLPAVRVSWRASWLGGIVSALLFLFGETIFAWYVGWSAAIAVYGQVGALFAFLLWVYVSALMLYLGAAVTRVVGRQV